ncbi:hypothetical protein ACFC0S_17175 [Streptomyces sp. NPDC056084]|uniref:hypothetical protein n=1 Tax=unclassified Streptomyces TaxID=2593676 RepID=UPI0035D653FD
MMPATPTVPHLAPVLPLAKAVTVWDLSLNERAVALYASDMPDSYAYKRQDEAQVEAWIIEGAVRLGLESLRQSAAFFYGFTLLGRAATVEQRKAHQQRFPKSRRLRRVASVASLTALMFEMGDEARRRGGCPKVEGACHCGGTGWAESNYDPEEPTSVALVACPGHNPNGIKPTPVGVFA